MKRTHILATAAIAAAVGFSPFVNHMRSPATITMEGAGYPCCKDFKGLVGASSLIVHAKIIAAAPSYYIPNQPAVDVSHPNPVITGTKATMVAIEHARSAGAPTPAPVANPGVLATDYTIEVTTPLRSTAAVGKYLTVSHIGGVAPDGTQVTAPDEPPLQVGDEEILFLMPYLQHGATVDKWQLVGGVQGRFIVDAAGQVQPFSAKETPYGVAYSGRTVAQLAAAIQAASS